MSPMMQVSTHSALLRKAVGAWVLPALAFALSANSAMADDIDTCVEASEAGQKLRDEGHYLDARETLLICARDVCPSVVKRDCFEELERLDAAIPTAVFGVSGVPAGRIGEVRVSIQGREGAFRVDGKPVMFDPGIATVRFEFDGATVVQTVVLQAGTRHRALDASFESPSPPSIARSAAPAPTPEKPVETGHSWIGYSLVGVGTIAVGGMAWMWVRGRGELRDLREGCGTTQSCKQDDVDGARNTILVGDILGGVGVAAIGLGSYLLLTDTQPDESALRVDAAMSDRGAGLSLSGAF